MAIRLCNIIYRDRKKDKETEMHNMSPFKNKQRKKPDCPKLPNSLQFPLNSKQRKRSRIQIEDSITVSNTVSPVSYKWWSQSLIKTFFIYLLAALRTTIADQLWGSINDEV